MPSKIERLAKLNEKDLREKLLVPLLLRMGFKAVSIYHGPRERGKDIICFDLDRLGGREYLGVVVKSVDLDGSVSSSRGLKEVLFQVEQCFDVPYEDLFGMRAITMDRVWVVTSQRILPGATDSVFASLEKQNLSKLVRFISGEILVDLLDQHYPEYWDDSLETADITKEKKDRLLRFTRNLLINLGGNIPDIESVLRQVTDSSFPPSISLPPDRTLTSLNPYRVELDSIASEYAHDFYSDACGSIRRAFFEAKESLYHAMFSLNDTIHNYENVIVHTDPKEFLDAYENDLESEYPFWRASYGSAGEAVSKLDQLRQGINDIDELRNNLAKAGKLEFAIALVASASDTKDDVSHFLAGSDRESFDLFWRIDVSDSVPHLQFLYDRTPEAFSFKTSHKARVSDSKWGRGRTRPISVEDILEEVQFEIRQYLDRLLIEMGVIEDSPDDSSL